MRTILFMIILAGAAPAFAHGDGAGKAIYEQTCVACHGVKGKSSIPGVADLAGRNGPLTKSDGELITSIRDGVQRPGSMMTMPPKGGNPALTDEEIQAVLDYIRKTFQG